MEASASVIVFTLHDIPARAERGLSVGLASFWRQNSVLFMHIQIQSAAYLIALICRLFFFFNFVCTDQFFLTDHYYYYYFC